MYSEGSMASKLWLMVIIGLGVEEIPKREPGELPMLLSLDTCCDPGRGQIPTVTKHVRMNIEW